MAEKIRLGNDIDIRWSLIDAEGDPYDLTGRDVAVEIVVADKKRVRVKDVEEAQQKVVNVIRSLEDKGEIVISRGQGDEMIV